MRSSIAVATLRHVRERQRRTPRAETQRELLEAAARVFARRGLHAASVDQIAEEAGLSTGALYSNFQGKEDLFLQLYEDRISRRATELRDILSGGDRSHGLSDVAAAVAEALRAEREWFLLYLEFALYAARNAPFADRFNTVRQEGLDQLVAGLAELTSGRRDRTALESSARLIRALIYGFAIDAVVDGGQISTNVVQDGLALIVGRLTKP